MLSFEIPGIPVGQHRPRFARRGPFVSVYSAKSDAIYRKQIQVAYLKAKTNMIGAEGKSIDFQKPAALRVELQFFIPVPDSWSTRKKERALNKEILPITKPDIDNLEKAIFDGLNGLAWQDDSQVVSVGKIKLYSSLPRVLVLIKEFKI